MLILKEIYQQQQLRSEDLVVEKSEREFMWERRIGGDFQMLR